MKKIFSTKTQNNKKEILKFDKTLVQTQDKLASEYNRLSGYTEVYLTMTTLCNVVAMRWKYHLFTQQTLRSSEAFVWDVGAF